MSTKERLHHLIDEMEEDRAVVLLMDLDASPPLTDEERAEIAEARAELRAGKGIPLDEAMRRLRAAR